MRKLILVLAIVGTLTGCSLISELIPIISPPVTTPPTTEPPAQVCLPELPWCSDVGLTCGECKHNPTQDPNHCEKAPECPPVPIDPWTKPPLPANGTYCPKKLDPNTTTVFMEANYWGQGIDSSVRVWGDVEFCQIIHGVETKNCHLEGWKYRVWCEMELLSGCPVWQFTVDDGKTWHSCSDNRQAKISCDHFGSTEYRDDPQTPQFEGRPIECAKQTDEFGYKAGFFMIPHGAGKVRACKPDETGCSTRDLPFDR